MPASLEYLERCAAETGYQVAALEKVTRLGEIADEVGRHPALRATLALKGGTAINLCSGPPTRMSVDLDFNFIGCADRRRTRIDRAAADPAWARGAADRLCRHGVAAALCVMKPKTCLVWPV